jgi:hypothetical protein
MAISDIRQRLSNAAVGTTASKRLLVTLGATVCLAAGAYYFYSGPPAGAAFHPAAPSGRERDRPGQGPADP